MPTSLSEISDKVQDQVFEVVKTSQDAVVDSVRSFAGTIDRVLPDTARNGLAANIPMAADAVDSAFEFAGRVLDTQHGFVTRVLDAVKPKAGAAPAAPTAPASSGPRATKASKTTAA